MKLQLWSEAFDANGAIPARFTADGDNVSPPLRWSNVPTKARELALVLEDLDAGEPRPLVHWIVWRIPPRLDGLPEAMGAPQAASTLGEPLEGTNSLDHAGYDGPEPPDQREHRYRFRLLALDTPLSPRGAADCEALERAMNGHVVEEAQLVAVYGRNL
ncbi:MAG: YbhB/YbcL family Raf kinase inhibitor-like protein [Myxococcota bacterium]|nr:YbhB/YbcL family Raf kinase inhibitor-like protein [Myxococcota bacterium]